MSRESTLIGNGIKCSGCFSPEDDTGETGIVNGEKRDK